MVRYYVCVVQEWHQTGLLVCMIFFYYLLVLPFLYFSHFPFHPEFKYIECKECQDVLPYPIQPLTCPKSLAPKIEPNKKISWQIMIIKKNRETVSNSKILQQNSQYSLKKAQEPHLKRWRRALMQNTKEGYYTARVGVFIRNRGKGSKNKLPTMSNKDKTRTYELVLCLPGDICRNECWC